MSGFIAGLLIASLSALCVMLLLVVWALSQPPAPDPFDPAKDLWT